MSRAALVAEMFNAASSGFIERVKELVAADASLVHAVDHRGMTPVGVVGLRARGFGLPPGRKAVYAFLMASGAKADLVAAIRAGDSHGVRHLAERPGVASKRVWEGQEDWLPLTVAADVGNVEAVEILLAAGAEVDADGGMALARAELGGHEECVKVLVAHGAKHPEEDAAGGEPDQVADGEP